MMTLKFFTSLMVVCIFVMTSCSPEKNSSGNVVANTKVSFEEEASLESPQEVLIKNLTPIESIRDLDKQVESYHLCQDLTKEQVEENLEYKRRIIQGTFDIQELTRLSLGKHWEEISPEQKDRVVTLMTKLLEKKAIFSKEQLSGDNKYYKIQYQKEVYDPEDPYRATVYSKMVVPTKKIDADLSYKLVKKAQVWKIFDVIVDDASLLMNYKLQF